MYPANQSTIMGVAFDTERPETHGVYHIITRPAVQEVHSRIYCFQYGSIALHTTTDAST
jgi:hypothetical protein